MLVPSFVLIIGPAPQSPFDPKKCVGKESITVPRKWITTRHSRSHRDVAPLHSAPRDLPARAPRLPLHSSPLPSRHARCDASLSRPSPHKTIGRHGNQASDPQIFLAFPSPYHLSPLLPPPQPGRKHQNQIPFLRLFMRVAGGQSPPRSLAVRPCPQHVPPGAATSAAGLRGGQEAGAAGDDACASAADAHAPLLRLLAHRAPGIVPVPMAPRQLYVGQRPREGRAVGDARCRDMVTPTPCTGRMCTCSRLMAPPPCSL